MSNSNKKDSKYWHEIAALYAYEAHASHFVSKRGLWFAEGVVGVYNNELRWEPSWREEELKQFRATLNEENIRELAFATFPLDVQEEYGYTYVMILDVGKNKTEWLCETMRICAEKTFLKMNVNHSRQSVESV